MHSLVNKNFSRCYNPNSTQNVLSDIKRLLTSRDTVAQSKACSCIIDVINRYNANSVETIRVIDYLLDNDITVFLCEAISNLDFSLFRSVLSCMRLLWRSGSFFSSEHGAQAMSAVLRAMAYYSSSSAAAAVDECLHFLCDLLSGINAHKAQSALSHQSAYSALQLLACLSSLAPRINATSNTVLSSALVLHALISYQPEGLDIKANTAKALLEVLKQWFGLLTGALHHSTLVGDSGLSGIFYEVICQLGSDVLGLTKCILSERKNQDFVQVILTDDQEINMLKQSAYDMRTSIHGVMSELVAFTKENQNQLSTNEYAVFLKFLLSFFYDNEESEILPEFCDILFTKGYLTMLPQVQIVRKDLAVRKVSTLILGEMLKVLADKYLNVEDTRCVEGTCARDIHMGLVELQSGIEKPQSLGVQLKQRQPYSLLVYIYFYCQATENPEGATAPLLPFLVEHILRLPKSFMPPPYIIKALWLVFAMSAISNGTTESLDERVYLEKATERLVGMLQPDPSVFYTHNPAILLWSFTSQRIPNYVRIHVLSQWLKSEDSLPSEMTANVVVWELLLNILVQSRITAIVQNCMEALQQCIDNGDEESRQGFSTMLWSMLPRVLSETLIQFDRGIEPTNICYILQVATNLLPSEVEQTTCVKIAVLVAAIFSKTPECSMDAEARYHYEYVCLKLCLYLLGLSHNMNENRVLVTYVNRVGFLPRVLAATNSLDERVACASLQLLSYIIHHFTKNNYKPRSLLQIQTELVIKSLRRDGTSERGACLMSLVYMVLNSGVNTPVVLSYDAGLSPSVALQCNALRALMFRIQLLLCCRQTDEESNPSAVGWKTLGAIFKHAIVSKNDAKLVAILTSQPWTNTLIHFQLTQKITTDFLNFTLNWLTLLSVTIKKNKEGKRTQISKFSLLNKTLLLIKKKMLIEEDETLELQQKILVVVKDFTLLRF